MLAKLVWFCRYWEDASDKYRGNLGTLLPLWRFYDQRVKKKMVTAMAWNPRYPDLFAVGYGSYDFMKQGTSPLLSLSLRFKALNPERPQALEPFVFTLLRMYHIRSITTLLRLE